MAELLLSAFLQVLFDRLASRELLNFANREKVRDLIKKWETKLSNISMLLEDAEDKATMGADSRVQPWLDDLKDLVYDIEDVVDEFVTQEGIRSLSKEVAATSGHGITRKVRSLLPSCCTDLSPRKLMSDRELRARMENIDDRLDFILEQKRDLGLNEGRGSMGKESYSYDRMTDSLPEHYVVGRQEDERAILAKLLSETDDHHLSVIPIIGMGGVGKTTLARSVFNNPAVVEAFPKRGWACVSDNFNMIEIARELLGSLGGSVGSLDDLNVLHNKIREILSKEKFLIVLDDYWNEDFNVWDRLYNLYRLGVKGSKVIVTTRLQKVVSMMKSGLEYHLGELSRGDCMSLLAYHAFGVDNFDTDLHLNTIGEKIADKCGGLPLGGLLRSKSSTREWEDILNSEIWDLPQGKDGIFPALKLSYFHLPSHLKRCFSFCAIFPQDYEFDRDYLVLLWMAEDLVYKGHQNLPGSMLDHGRQHFDELLNRALSLRQYDQITEIPNCIGHLKHLRFLDFSGNRMKELPDSICTLYNLETLILKNCSNLTELPPGMNKLINLRCLDISFTFHLKKMPMDLVCLHKLEILPKFIVGKEDGLRLKELQHMRNLHRELVISNLQNVREVGDARDANLKAKANHTFLALKWDVDSGNSSSRNANSELEVMCFLEPHPNIEEVEIDGYGGKSFPAWIGSPSLVNIKRMRLGGCENITKLPSLGLLPSLRELVIYRMNGVRTVGPEFFGNVSRPFPSLKVLTFMAMQAWEAWSLSSRVKQFPRLVQLEITNCPLLIAPSFMRGLPLLEKLTLESCNYTVVAPISSNALSKIYLTSILWLEYLNEEFLRSLNALESLVISGCDGLRWLWDDDAEAVESLARLKYLRVARCVNLEKLPNNMQRLTSLREIQIIACSKLEYVPDGMMNCSKLEILSIYGCESLICFPEGATLPTTMKLLVISNCKKLERLPEGIIEINSGDTCSSKHAIHLQLKSLSIISCPSLKPLVGSNKKQGMKLAPGSLKVLKISDSGAVLDCLLEEISLLQDGNVKSITHRLHMLTTLTELSLSGSLSLQVEVFPQLPSSLKSLSLQGCNKIKSLPHRMHTSTSLKVLELRDLSIESFPEGGLPLSLESLRVQDCKNLRQPMAEWGLHNLTALKKFYIDGEIGRQEMTCFPPPSPSLVQAASDWSLLLPNIEFLSIHSQLNLQSKLQNRV